MPENKSKFYIENSFVIKSDAWNNTRFSFSDGELFQDGEFFMYPNAAQAFAEWILQNVPITSSQNIIAPKKPMTSVKKQSSDA